MTLPLLVGIDSTVCDPWAIVLCLTSISFQLCYCYFHLQRYAARTRYQMSESASVAFCLSIPLLILTYNILEKLQGNTYSSKKYLSGLLANSTIKLLDRWYRSLKLLNGFLVLSLFLATFILLRLWNIPIFFLVRCQKVRKIVNIFNIIRFFQIGHL